MRSEPARGLPVLPSSCLIVHQSLSFILVVHQSPEVPVEAESKHLVTVNGNSSVVMIFVLSTRSSQIRDES